MISLRVQFYIALFRSAKGRIIDIQGSYSISEPAPRITFLLACISHTAVSAIMELGRLIFKAVNHLVPFTSVSRFVLLSQENGICE
jgi:hypothetical protein